MICCLLVISPFSLYDLLTIVCVGEVDWKWQIPRNSFFFFFSLSREYIFMNLSWIDVYVFTFFHIVFCYLLHSPCLCWRSRLKMKNFQKNNGKWKEVYVSMTLQFLDFPQSVMIWFNIFSSCWSWSTNIKQIYHCNKLFIATTHISLHESCH